MADPLEDLLRSCTVRVTGGPAPGAGFFVAPGKVLTCVHEIGDSAALAVSWERDCGPVLEAGYLAGLRCWLIGDARSLPWTATIPTSPCCRSAGSRVIRACASIREWPSLEDNFLVFGYPEEGGAVQRTPARLTYRGTKGTLPTAYLDLASDTIKPGMSGAAVLNLRSAAVCGVMVASKHPAHPYGARPSPGRPSAQT